MQSSALSDGVDWLRSCSARTGAAHFSIGLTEHHHRQSGVVRRHHEGVGHRQRMACPAASDLLDGHNSLRQRIRPRHQMSCQDGDPHARVLLRYAASKGPLPDDRFAERRSTVGPSIRVPLADPLQLDRLYITAPTARDSSCRDRVGSKRSAARQHGPDNSSQLIGQGDDNDITLCSCKETAQPCSQQCAARCQTWQRRAGAVDKQHAQIAVSSLCDSN